MASTSNVLLHPVTTISDISETMIFFSGPLLHCVVWNDGEKWVAAVDTSDLYVPDSDEGKLADYSPLTDFDKQHKFATFSAEDACNYGVHIYDEGNILSIVVEAGKAKLWDV